MPNPTQKPVLGPAKTRPGAFHDIAPGERFWHGPDRFQATLWAKRACFLSANRGYSGGVGDITVYVQDSSQPSNMEAIGGKALAPGEAIPIEDVTSQTVEER